MLRNVIGVIVLFISICAFSRPLLLGAALTTYPLASTFSKPQKLAAVAEEPHHTMAGNIWRGGAIGGVTCGAFTLSHGTLYSVHRDLHDALVGTVLGAGLGVT